jgi:hypothetical protein
MATDAVSEVLRDMRRLTAWSRQADEGTEARVQGLNDLVRFLAATVAMPPIKVLGDMVIAPDPPVDSEKPQTITMLQIALIAPHGIGIVFWSEAAREHASEYADGLERLAAHYFTRYDELEPRLRRIVHAYLPQLHALAEATLRGPE